MSTETQVAERYAYAESDTETGPLVAKSNRLIETSYKLTMVEQQMLLFAICEARDKQTGLSKDSSVSIEAKDFAERFGLHPARVYKQLKDASIALYEREIKIYDVHLKSGKPRVVKSRWVSDIAYTDGAGVVELTFAPKIVPYITRLESEFTSYRLACVAKMSSIYAVRVYELLVQYVGIGQRSFELLSLKEILGIANEYSIINDLKKRVLDVAMEQINEHSDMRVSYSQTKTGRAVTGFVFKMRLKPSLKESATPSSRPSVPAKPKKKKPVQLGLTGVESPPKTPVTPEGEANRKGTLQALAELKAKSS